MKPPLAVQVAQETLDLYRENLYLKEYNAELLEYRDRYIELLNSSISNSAANIAGVLNLAMTPGVMDAIATHNESRQ